MGSLNVDERLDILEAQLAELKEHLAELTALPPKERATSKKA